MSAALGTPQSIHYSKKDQWCVVLAWMVGTVLLLSAAAFALAPLPVALRIVMPLILLVAAQMQMWTLYGTRYVLTDAGIRVYAGPFHWWIPYGAIAQVSPRRSLAAGPACSLDRLEIMRDDSSFGLMISPEKKQEFLSDLVSLASSLRLAGDQVVRK